MKPAGSGIWRAIPASLLLHLLAAAVVLQGISPAPARMLPVIDLSLLPPSPSGERSVSRTPAESRGGPARTPEPPRTGRSPRSAEPAIDPPPPPAPLPAASEENLQPGPSPAVSLPIESSTGKSSPASYTDGDGGPHSAVSLPMPGPASGNPGHEGGGGSYGYLRDAIQREIAYPAMARRMGWEGRVIVAFVILPDGAVRDVRVFRGSGFPVLDRSAVEAVRSASPFRRPPAEAEVLTPVVYKLD